MIIGEAVLFFLFILLINNNNNNKFNINKTKLEGELIDYYGLLQFMCFNI